MDQRETPLFDALMKYQNDQQYSFHVPGHKDGLTFLGRGKDLYKSILSIDGTEVIGLDDLYEPAEAILRAQELLKELYKTVKSYFLVNGSTVGNLAMIMSTCKPGDKVLVQRDSHKSIFNALKLARVKPVFISPEVSEVTQISTGLSKEALLLAFNEHPDAKALVLTYPNYYGIAKEDYPEIIGHAKEKGLLVLVDEAHGAHFILGQTVPPSALQMGADIVVQSAHKTLPAMTMGSYLHVNSKSVLTGNVESALELLQTSSPSYPIMASLDLARAYLASIDREKLQIILNKIDHFRHSLEQIGLKIINDRAGHQDPFKLILASNVGGFQLQESLERAGLYPEMADPNHVLLTLPIDDQIPIERLTPLFKIAFRDLPAKNNKGKISVFYPVEKLSRLAVTYEDAANLIKESVPLEESEGLVAAQMVVPYPPGIPLLIDGERILKAHIEQVKMLRRAGAKFHGLKKDQTILVYKK